MTGPVRQILIVFFIIISSVVLFLKDLKLVSATYDEDFSYVRNSVYLIRNFKWDQEYITLHPPLMYYLHGWPLLFLKNLDYHDTLFLSRLGVLPIFITFIIFLFFLTKKLYGELAAYFAVLFYSFSTEILAHARLVTADYTQATFIFIALATFYYFLKKPEPKQILLAGVFLGFAFISKYSALLLIPLYLIISVVVFRTKNFVPMLLKLMIIFIIGIIIIHSSYLLKESIKIPSAYKTSIIAKFYANSITKPLLFIFPNSYLAGLDYQLSTSKGIWWGYFAGKQYLHGLWYFYPVAFLLKTPIPLLLILFLAIFKLLKEKIINEFEKTILISITFFFIYFSFFNKLIIGLRYLLMIYPLIFLFSARLLDINRYPLKFHKPYYVLLAVLIILYIFQTVKISPHYLAFTSELIGGPKNAYKYFADSNLDWNQNTELFANYLKSHPEITAVNPRKPTSGLIAVNVNEMNLYYYQDYQWLRRLDKDPKENIGYTWLIFEIKKEDLAK